MKLVFCVVLFVTFLQVAVQSRESEAYPGIDALIQRLKQDEWNDDETPCLEKTLQILLNVKNFTLWATWVWDANQFPSGSLYGSWYQLSNFGQCMNPPWLETHPQFKTQYCLAEVEMAQIELKKRQFDPYGSTEVFLRTKTKFSLPVNRFTWGICVPDSCQPPSIVKLVKNMYLGTHFRAISKPNITVDNCQVAGVEEEYSTGFYLFTFLSTTLLLITVASTFYLTYIRSQTAPTNTIGAVLLNSFCMKNNTAELTKFYKREIGVFNGIRFISAVLVVIGHVSTFTIASGCLNSGDLNKERHFIEKLITLHVVVDTFFAMSGLLLIREFLAKKQNLFLVLCKRYTRLAIFVGFAVFYYTSVLKFLGTGPLWKKYIGFESLMCEKNWLYTLLMININVGTKCFPILWYIACDFQLSIFATILFYIYQRKKSFAFKVFGFSAVMSLVIPGVLTYWHNFPSIFAVDMEPVVNLRGYKPYNYVYGRSYSRAGPYLVGVAMGYLMHVYKPTHYRRSISAVFSIIGTVISVLLMLLISCLGVFVINREEEQGALEAAAIAASFRTVWAVAVLCIVGMCEYGHVPLLTKLLSMPILTPLSRLSYGLYMIHLPVLLQAKKVMTIESIPVFDLFNVAIETAGVVVVTLVISYVQWLVVGAPLKNLSDKLIFNRHKVKEDNQVTQEAELEEKTK